MQNLAYYNSSSLCFFEVIRLNKQQRLFMLRNSMDTISQRFAHMRSDINGFQQAAQRQPHSVLLLAVSKNKPASDIALAYQTGQRHFGENYCQEAFKKTAAIRCF